MTVMPLIAAEPFTDASGVKKGRQVIMTWWCDPLITRPYPKYIGPATTVVRYGSKGDIANRSVDVR